MILPERRRAGNRGLTLAAPAADAQLLLKVLTAIGPVRTKCQHQRFSGASVRAQINAAKREVPSGSFPGLFCVPI